MKQLTDNDGSRDKTQEIVIKAKSKRNPPEKGVSPWITLNLGYVNKAPIDDSEYLCLHYQKMQAKWLNTWNVRKSKGNSKV